MADPVTLAITAAMMAAQMAMTATQKIKGPRLDDLKVSLADYGTPIPRFWGKRRFESSIIWAEDLREKKVTSKTKGGKYQNYKYWGTFAVLICDHEIDAVTRIWMDKHLVYDVSSGGPISVGGLFKNPSGVKLRQDKNLRIYLGTETQGPDPRMEAWCEDRYGADSCPAYRGSSYIVFEEIPLEKFGNRIPQITVEAIRTKQAIYPNSTTAATMPFAGYSISTGGEWMVTWDANGYMEWWDLANRTSLGIHGLDGDPGPFATTVKNVALAQDGTAYFIGTRTVGVSTETNIYTTSPVGHTSRSGPVNDAWFSGPTRVFEIDGDNTLYIAAGGGYFHDQAWIAGNSGRDFCLDSDWEVWGLFHPNGSSNQFYVQQLTGTGGANFTITGSVTRSSPTTAFMAYVASEDHFYVLSDGYWYLIDRLTGAIKSSGTQSWATYDFNSGWLQQSPGNAKSFWSQFTEVSLETGATIRSISSSNWSGSHTFPQVYDPVNHAIMAGSVNWHYLDRVDDSGVTLATIVNDVSGWCNLSGQDTSTLTQTIDGYSVTQGAGKDMIDPLLTIHDVDARPHDFTAQFLVRGSSPSGTLLTEDFVRSGEAPRYMVTVQQDTDLPRRITINFADNNNDQQTNTVISQRPLDAVDSSREETIDLTTYVATPSTAQQLSDRRLRRIWNEREKSQLSLTAQNLGLEPGDVKTVSLDGETRPARLQRMTIRQSVIECEWVRSEPSLHTLNGASGAAMEGRDPEVIYVPAMTRAFVLDTPLITDADNDINPLLYVAAGAYGSSWPGALIYRGDDGTYDDEFATVESTSKATWGLCAGTLATANPWLWDRGNSVSVNVFGTLTSVTEADIEDDPSTNLAAIGDNGRWEFVNFTTATLTGTSGTANTYTISGFKRGRRGTEANVGNHAIGDAFVLLSTASIVEMGTDDVGDDLSFKGQSIGRDVDSAAAIDVAYDGNSLKPYAPARVKWSTDGTDLFGEIIRRTRVGGSWLDSGVVSLSENSEAYEVDVYNGATYKRTITVSGTNTFTYTAAEMSADGLSLTNRPNVEVYQISDTVGRGFALAA